MREYESGLMFAEVARDVKQSLRPRLGILCMVIGGHDRHTHLLFAPYMTPALSSVHIPFAETGELAVELLLRRIRGDEVPPEPSLLPVQLAVRASCGSGALPASTQQPAHPPLLSEVQP